MQDYMVEWADNDGVHQQWFDTLDDAKSFAKSLRPSFLCPVDWVTVKRWSIITEKWVKV
jgi:hypothetical protein